MSSHAWKTLLLVIALCTIGRVDRAVAQDHASTGRHFYVSEFIGNDSADGLSPDRRDGHGPFRTINAAIEAAGPGDTIHLMPSASPYRQTAAFVNKSGEPGRPIVLDGHGQTLWGTEPVDAAGWRQLEPGLFVHDTLYGTIDQGHSQDPETVSAVMARFFLQIDGVMVRMGRTAKGPSADFKAPGDLEPGEWTFDSAARAFYLKTADDRTLADYTIAAPQRANGVSFSGTNKHIVVRNITAQYFYNDGFNIHGSTRDLLLQNIQALECGDDGISAHGDCRLIVRGFLSRGNSTGICHTDNSQTMTEDALIYGCHGVDVHLLNNGNHLIKNSQIIADAAVPMLNVGGPSDEDHCKVYMHNVTFIDGDSLKKEIIQAGGSTLAMWQCTITGVTFGAGGGAIHLADTTIDGETILDAARPPLHAEELAAFEAELLRQIMATDDIADRP